jgi:hypothetical protein
MIWPFNKKEASKKCLVCNKKGDFTAKVQYSYKGGTDEAYLCDACATHFDIAAVDHDESI